MLKPFADRTHIREEYIDGLGPWTWTKNERGSWDGPKADWESSHKDFLLRHLNGGRRTCIQAGGNHGMYPKLLRQYFERVYTFEPDYLNFYCLAQNCQDEFIFKYQAFLGDTHGHLAINRQSEDNTGMHKIGCGDGPIPMLLIDDFILQDVDFIWLDIEGAELRALNGAIETLKHYKPLLMLENANDKITDFLKNYGYQIVGGSVSDTIYKVF